MSFSARAGCFPGVIGSVVRNPKVIGKAPSADMGLLIISARVTQEESVWKRGPDLVLLGLFVFMLFRRWQLSQYDVNT